MVLRSDARNFGRSLAISALAFAVAFALSAASDEGGVPWLVRLTRALPMAPFAGALGTWLTLRSERAKTDALALESIGRSHAWNAAGVVAGGASFALFAALLLAAWQKLDVVAIFPSFAAAPRVEWNGSAFVDRQHGLAFDAIGNTSHIAADAVTLAGPSEARERAAASLALAFSSLAFPLLAGALARHASARTLAIVGAIALVTVLAFDAVASGRASPFVVVAPPLGLSVWALIEYLRSSWFVPSR